MTVTLREITAANRAAVEALAVTDEQTHYVAGVTASITEAARTPNAAPWYRAVYDDETPVGFVMISDGITPENMKSPDFRGPYFLWRLLIDQRHQGRGYGAATIALVIDYLRTAHDDAEVLLTSCVPGPATPLDFYLGQGFHRTGEIHDNEIVLEKPL
jgi:diamine N-acetyltransferase